MLDRINDAVYIISAELDTLDHATNIQRTQDLRTILNDLNIDHKRVRGCYKGRTEVSFVVKCSHIEALSLVEQFGQESALYLDSSRKASLFRPAEGLVPEHIGQFVECDLTTALNSEAYTYDIGQDTYYHVV